SGDTRAIKAFGLRLTLDVLLFEDEMKELIKPPLYRRRLNPPLELSEMWNAVKEREWAEDDTALIRAVLVAVGHVAVFDLLDSKSFEAKESDRVKRFTSGVFELQQLVSGLFGKLTDLRPRVMRSILEDEGSCVSVVAHLFNGKRQNLVNADLDMLKTV